jgi:hypothetical protein
MIAIVYIYRQSLYSRIVTGVLTGNDMFYFRNRIEFSGFLHLCPHPRKIAGVSKVDEHIAVPHRAVKRLHLVHPHVGVIKLGPRDVGIELKQPAVIDQ